MTAFRYLLLAYSLIWILLALYLSHLGRRLTRLSHELQEVRRRLERR